MTNKKIYVTISLLLFLIFVIYNEVSTFWGYGTLFKFIPLILSGNFNKVYQAPHPELYRDIYYNSVGVFNNIMIFGTQVYQVLIIALVIVAGLLVHLQSHTIYNFVYPRTRHIHRTRNKYNVLISFYIALCAFGAFVLFWVFTCVVSKPITDAHAPMSYLVLGLFGSDFFQSYPRLHFLIDGFFVFFLTTFVYSLLIVSIYKITQNLERSMSFVVIYFFGLGLINYLSTFTGFRLSGEHLVDFMLLPGALLTTGTFNVPPSYYFSSLIIPLALVFSIFMIPMRKDAS